MIRCFACDRSLGRHPRVADTRDGQVVAVGAECHRLIIEAGDAGWQPSGGGPRLYPCRVEWTLWPTRKSENGHTREERGEYRAVVLSEDKRTVMAACPHRHRTQREALACTKVSAI